LQLKKTLNGSVSVTELKLARADVALGVPWAPRPCEPARQGQPEASDLATLAEAAEAAFPFCEGLSGACRCVFGEGRDDADLVFVGEGPGAEEDRQGRPFVGPAGRKLDEIMAAMGLSRVDVYICNVLKARPPGNRAPLPDEVAASAPWLHAQLRLIRPKIIVALGGAAAKVLLETDTGITRLRGRIATWHDPDSDLQIPVMPTFHPAYILRNYTEEVRRQVWHDMQAAMAVLSGS
jgi:DNA polymerase